MLVVSSSVWECKGMIMPEFMLYIVIGLWESPRALYKHKSCSVNCIRTTLGTGSWTACFRNTGWPVNVVWTLPRCVSAACALCESSHFIHRCWENRARAEFWSQSSTWCVFHLSLQMQTHRHGTGPVPVGPLVPACHSAGAGRGQIFATTNMRH